MKADYSGGFMRCRNYSSIIEKVFIKLVMSCVILTCSGCNTPMQGAMISSGSLPGSSASRYVQPMYKERDHSFVPDSYRTFAEVSCESVPSESLYKNCIDNVIRTHTRCGLAGVEVLPDMAQDYIAISCMPRPPQLENEYVKCLAGAAEKISTVTVKKYSVANREDRVAGIERICKEAVGEDPNIFVSCAVNNFDRQNNKVVYIAKDSSYRPTPPSSTDLTKKQDPAKSAATDQPSKAQVGSVSPSMQPSGPFMDPEVMLKILLADKPKKLTGVKGKEVLATELFTRASASVYVVLSSDNKSLTQGSAVAINKRLALTNSHVVAGMTDIVLARQGRIGKARIVALRPDKDQCFLYSEELELNPVEAMRPYSDLRIGEKVYAIGTPKGLEMTISEGILSGLRQTSAQGYIQTSAPISPGSSGGGLFDSRGRLVGITQSTLKESQNLNFAIGVDEFFR